MKDRIFIPIMKSPFLRYNVDRPEFLFGIDLNNNGWVDRFENDDLPDYPIKKIIGDITRMSAWM